MPLLDCLTAASEIVDKKTIDTLVKKRDALIGNGISESDADQQVKNDFVNEYGKKLHDELNGIRKSAYMPQVQDKEFSKRGDQEKINQQHEQNIQSLKDKYAPRSVNPTTETEGKKETEVINEKPVEGSEVVNEGLNNTKIVDENGRPQIVYHATNAKFYEFKEGYSSEWANKHGIKRNGFYFTNNKEYANSIASQFTNGDGKLIEVHLNIKKPKIINPSFEKGVSDLQRARQYDEEVANLSKEKIEQLKSQGYDGIVYDKGREIVAFDANQIKKIPKQQPQENIQPNIIPSIIGSDKDLKGNKKEEWMHLMSNEIWDDWNRVSDRNMFIDKWYEENQSRFDELNSKKDLTKSEQNEFDKLKSDDKKYQKERNEGAKKYSKYKKWQDTISQELGYFRTSDGGFWKAIKDGRMTANDAKKIIESAGLEVPNDIKELAAKENTQNIENQTLNENKGGENAINKGEKPEGNIPEHQNGEGGGKTASPSGSNSTIGSEEIQQKEKEVTPPPPTEPPTSENTQEEAPNEQRKFTKQMLRDENLTPELKTDIEKTLDYARQTNEISLAKANEIIDKVGMDEAQNFVINDNELQPVVRNVLGQILIKNYNDLAAKATDTQTKNYYNDKAIQVATFVTERFGTEGGRSIQIFSLWSRLSPEAQFRSAVNDVQKQSKEKLIRRRKDVNNIGDKFKKANEDTVDEITNSPEVKDTIQKTESKRTVKAKDKINQAKKKRAEIIKKYKAQKGTNLYSTVGLTTEGIEFAGNIAKTYIDEGVANIEIIVDKIRQHLEEVSKKPINDVIQNQIKNISQENIDKVSNKKIISGVKQLETEIGKIVKKHYTVTEEQKTSLTQKFINELGLEKEDAEQLSSDIQNEFDKIATRKKRNILYNEKARFEKIQKGLKGVNKVEPKTLQSEMIKYSNLGAFDNADFEKMIADKLGLGKITQAESEEINRLAQRVQKAPEGSPKNDATEDLLRYRANLKGTSWGEIAQAAWYAEILSGYLTHLRNIVSTFFNGMGFFGAEAVRNPRSLPFLAVGGAKGVARGSVEAWHTLSTGRSPIHVRKVETPTILERKNFVGGYLNPVNYLKFVGRALVAEDVLQFQGLKEMRATQLAYREAAKEGYRNPFSKQTWKIVNDKLLNTSERLDEATKQVNEEGLKGAEGKRRTYELMEQSRPIQMTDDAYGFAAKGTFNHKSEGTLGALTNAVAHALDININGTKPLRYVVPFTQIITNVVNTGLDYSPIGYIRALRGERGFKSFEQNSLTKGAYHELTKEERNQLIARASLGVGLTLTFYALSHVKAKDDKPLIEITGGGTGDFRKDIQLREEGWQPYSIKIGDTYYSYKLTPLFFNLGFVGNMNDAEKYIPQEDKKTFLKRMELASFKVGNQVADMTWINSAGTFLGAFADNTNASAIGSKVQNSLTQTAKGFVIPQGYTQAAQAYESIFNVPKKQVNNMWETMIQDIPIARNSLNDQINALGDPVVRDVDLIASGETKDPIWRYILDKNGWVAPVNRNTIIVFDNNTQEDRPINDNEYYQFSKIRGGKIKADLKNLIEKGAYTYENGELKYKTSEQLRPYEVQKLLTEYATIATKETKAQLFTPHTNPKEIVVPAQ